MASFFSDTSKMNRTVCLPGCTLALCVLVLTGVLVGGCASEDPNIVNPPPGDANISVRLFNMVPDDRSRWLQMELGYQSTVVDPGGFSAAVQSPGDSTHLIVYAGSQEEYRSPIRARFIRQSVNNVYAVASAENPTAFDTVLLSNANRSLTTLPVAQVRAINLLPDSTSRFDIRQGCPSGSSLLSGPLAFRASSLYREVPPGQNVFSVLRLSSAGVEVIGTFECTLQQYTPYTIMVYTAAIGEPPTISLFDESDFTTQAIRPFTPVRDRESLVRVANLTSQTASLTMVRTQQNVAQDVAPSFLTAYRSVPTCETNSPDVLQVSLDDGSTAVDSISLQVRGQYTVVLARAADDRPQLIIVPPTPVVYNASGRALLRVVGATNRSGGVNISTGGRTSLTAANGYSSGVTITNRIGFDDVSAVAILEPGEVPLTISTTTAPAAILQVLRCSLNADRSYLLLVTDGSAYLLDVTDQPGPMAPVEDAALFRYVNGASGAPSAATTIGSVVQNGTVFYRNSIATAVPFGEVTVAAGGTINSYTAEREKRTLVVYTENNGGPTQFGITDFPLSQDARYSYRRVINATDDVPLIGVSYDTSFVEDPDDPSSPHVARRVGFGTASPPHRLDRVIRGSMYVYNHDTRTQIFSLPIELGPLGNNYSLIVVGTASRGYDVIVLQEF